MPFIPSKSEAKADSIYSAYIFPHIGGIDSKKVNILTNP